jgi:hypothetical protein
MAPLNLACSGQTAAAAIEHSELFKQRNSTLRNLRNIIDVSYVHLTALLGTSCGNTIVIPAIELFAMAATKKMAGGSRTARHI